MADVFRFFPSTVPFVNPNGTLTPEGIRALQVLAKAVSGQSGFVSANDLNLNSVNEELDELSILVSELEGLVSSGPPDGRIAALEARIADLERQYVG